MVTEDIEGDAMPTPENPSVFPVTIPTISYHIVLLLKILYYGMLFSDWGEA